MGGGGGGSPKSSNVMRGDHFSEVTFNGEDRLNFNFFLALTRASR